MGLSYLGRPPTVLPMSESTTGDRTLRVVTLTGEAAIAVRNTLGEPAKRMLARKAAPVAEETYRIVLDRTQQKALQDGTQRFANPGKGDASLRLKDVKTGGSMPEARLEKVSDSAKAAKPSVTKVLGPVAWEAMAMATQQHYLVEISDKLEGIASGIEELLERDDDDKRAATAGPAAFPRHTGPTRRCSPERSRGRPRSSRFRHRRRRRCSSAPTPAARSRWSLNRRRQQRREATDEASRQSFPFRLPGRARCGEALAAYPENPSGHVLPTSPSACAPTTLSDRVKRMTA